MPTNSAIRKTLAENIRAFRLRRKLTQNKLDDLAGFPQNTVWRWEDGRNSPSVCALYRLAQALKTTPNKLLGF